MAKTACAMRIEVTSQVIDTILRASAAAHPEECCGLLLGSESRISAAEPTRNVHPSPDKQFEIDPQALINAYRAEREGGACLVGYYHSHPSGAPIPSVIDEAQAAPDGKVWAICAQGDVRFWQSTDEGFAPLFLPVIGS